ncbi:hypothetical protein F4780DRAFT_542587 [Xylariomycetidae sp. FL0641]|nr:hypothetical protein F4780DRAFT_542587 [Xylariomycetidae sp. FL0641]
MGTRKRDKLLMLFRPCLRRRAAITGEAQAATSSNTDTPGSDEKLPELVATGPRSPLTLWEHAFARLPETDKAALDQLAPPDEVVDPLDHLLKATKEQQARFDSNAWKIRLGGNTIVLREVLGNIASKLDLLKGIGDVAVGLCPQASIPWTAMKILVQATTADQKQSSHLILAVEAVAILLCRCRIYETLYLHLPGTDATVLNRLSEAIIEIYARTTSLLLQSIATLRKGPIKRATHAFLNPEQLPSIIDELRDLEDRAEKEAANCERFQLQSDRVIRDVHQEALRNLVNDRISSLQSSIEKAWVTLDHSQRAAMLNWVSPIESKSDHNHAKRDITEHTGEWLLCHNRYLEWIEAPSSQMLWVHGIPGAGKTKLSTRVVDAAILSSQKHPSAEAVAYFYCDKTREDHRNPDHILPSLVRQLSVGMCGQAVARCIQEKYITETASGAPGRLTTADCRKLLTELSESYQKTTLIVDGLDECDEGTRHRIMETLAEVSTDCRSTIKMYVASRDNGDIKSQYGTGRHLLISATDNQGDIEKFVLSEMERSPWCRTKMSHKVRQEVLSTFRRKSKGMFQWAALHIRELLGFKCEADVLRYLERLPEGLKNSYKEIWEKMTSEQKGTAARIAEAAFRWLMFSLQPLSPDELVRLTRRTAGMAGYMSDDIDIDWIFEACNNLMVVARTSGSTECRFSHLSVQEYLEQHVYKATDECHYSIVVDCLGWLRQSKLEECPEVRLEFYPVAWTDHLALCGRRQDQATEAVMEFLGTPFNSSETYQQWMRLARNHAPWQRNRPCGYNAYRYSYWGNNWHPEGLRDAIYGCIDLGCHIPIMQWIKCGVIDADMEDGDANPMLSLAAARRHVGLCTALLDAGAAVNPTRDHAHLHQLPIFACTTTRYKYDEYEASSALIRLFLDRGAKVEAEPAEGMFGYRIFGPLHCAIITGDLQLLERLLECGANPNVLAEYCASEARWMTPLMLVAERDYHNDFKGQSFAELLLDHGADINAISPSEYRLTALEFSNGRDLTTYLLQRGATLVSNLGHKQKSVLLSAWRAVSRSVLIDHGANPDDALGRYYPRLTHVPGSTWDLILVKDFAANVNHRSDLDGLTPLEAAALDEHSLGNRLCGENIKSLIDLGADPNLTGGRLGTALHIFITTGRLELAAQLMSLGGTVNMSGEGREEPVPEFLHLSLYWDFEPPPLRSWSSSESSDY